MIKVLVVDDSAFMRHILRNELDADPEVEVVDTARDGVDALAKIEALRPDVVTLDLEMPRMDGFAALRQIMAEFPRPVIILSSLSQEGADATMRALRLGAVDFVPKPIKGVLDLQVVRDDLLNKIKHVAGLHVSKLLTAESGPPVERANAGFRLRGRSYNKIVVIGASTGGPRALYEVVPHLPQSLPAGVLVVQHMPAGFTRSLAARLDELSSLKVKEAEPGDIVQAGLVLIAPGNYHMGVSRGGRVGLDQMPPEHGVRPAVNVTMEAVARVYGPAAIGVILTGMGCDGTRGARLIKAAGGQILAEDESSCVVYGMLRSAIEAGVVDKVAPLRNIASEIVAMVAEEPSVRHVTNY